MRTEAKCPFNPSIEGGTSNRDWWPNQLRLDLWTSFTSTPPSPTRWARTSTTPGTVSSEKRRLCTKPQAVLAR
jgi:hypothetical protein